MAGSDDDKAGGGRAGEREPSSRNALVICLSARRLSNGLRGMSPQSMIVRGDMYGFRPRRGLKPRAADWRAEAARIARGPKRAPERRKGD